MALSWLVLLVLGVLAVSGLVLIAAIVAVLTTTRRRHKKEDGRSQG